MSDSLSRLSTISKIGNRENIVAFKAMLIHELIEASFLWHLPASRWKSKKLKNLKEIRPQVGEYLYRLCLYV